MAGNLQERIDFALNYQVDVSELVKTDETLGKVEKSNEKAKKSIDENREAWTKKRREMMETGKTAQMTEEMQKRLSIAVSNTNETVRDARLGMELLKLEYQEGSISQEQYTQGIQELRNRLEGADVITLSQVRALRQLSQAQRQANMTTNQMTKTVTGSGPAFTSFAQIIQDLPFGFTAISNNIPFAAQQFQNLTLRTGGTTGALKAVLGVMTGPGGLLLLLTSLVPALAVASRNMDLFNTSLIDGEAAGEAYNSVLQDMLDNISEIRGLDTDAPFNTEELQSNLSEYEKIRDENEKISQVLKDQRNLLQAGSFQAELTTGQQEKLNLILSEIEARENNIEQVSEKIGKIKAQILTNEILLNDERTRALALEKIGDPLFERRLELKEEAHKRQVEQLAEQQQIDERDRKNERDRIQQIDQMRLEANQRIIGGIKERSKLRAEEVRKEIEMRQMLLNPPRVSFGSQDDEGPANQNALIRQQLEQDARLAMVQDSVTREKAIRLQMQRQFEQERLDLIRQGITDEQSLNNLRILQEQELQNELLALQQQQQDARLTLWANYEAAVQGFGQAIVEGSGANAKQMFEMNKALNLAMAISSGARAVVEALPNLPLAISVGALAAAQIAKIAATQYKGGGSTQSTAADRPQIAFRGIQADTVQGAAVPQPQQVNMPDTVRLVDSAGNLLTKLEWERDKEGGSAYVSGRSS